MHSNSASDPAECGWKPQRKLTKTSITAGTISWFRGTGAITTIRLAGIACIANGGVNPSGTGAADAGLTPPRPETRVVDAVNFRY